MSGNDRNWEEKKGNANNDLVVNNSSEQKEGGWLCALLVPRVHTT